MGGTRLRMGTWIVGRVSSIQQPKGIWRVRGRIPANRIAESEGIDCRGRILSLERPKRQTLSHGGYHGSHEDIDLASQGSKESGWKPTRQDFVTGDITMANE